MCRLTYGPADATATHSFASVKSRQYAGSPGHSTYCYAELTASLINFLHYCSPSSGFYSARKDNRGRCTDNPSGRHPSGLTVPPHLHHLPFLCWMPFVPQPFQFILAWDKHWIMLPCIPGGLSANEVNLSNSHGRSRPHLVGNNGSCGQLEFTSQMASRLAQPF